MKELSRSIMRAEVGKDKRMQTPLVSIVLPTWNGSAWLKESIDSVLSQTYTNFELIIVNDCSTDNTEEIVNSYTDGRIRYLRNSENKKLPTSLNVGFEKARGEFFTWTSDDNRYKTKGLEVLVEYLTKNPDVDFVYGNQDIIDENGMFVREQIQKSEDWIPVYSVFGAYFMYRSKVHYKTGGYASDWFVVEDFQFVLTAYNLGFKFKKIEENQYEYRVQTKSLSVLKRKEQAEGLYNLCYDNLQKNMMVYPKNVVFRICVYLLEFANKLSSIEKAERVLFSMCAEVGGEIAQLIPFSIKQWLSCNAQNGDNVRLEGEKIKIVFWGAGQFCSSFLDASVKSGINVAYIVDNDEKKQGTYVSGVIVRSPEVLKNENKENTFVFITVSIPQAVKAITCELSNMGYSKTVFECSKFFEVDNLSHFCPVENYIEGLEYGYLARRHTSQNLLITNLLECKIYRCVNNSLKNNFIKIFERVKEGKLFGDYIIPTKFSNKVFGQFELTFEHDFIPVVTYCYEMSPLMLRDLVLFLIEFMERLETFMLCLKDVNCMNVTFYKGKFIYFDFGSIKDIETKSSNFFEFMYRNVNLLILFSKSAFNKAYMYLRNLDNVCTRVDLIGYLSSDEIDSYDEIVIKFLTGNKDKFKLLNNFIERISKNLSAKNIWREYQQYLFSDLYMANIYPDKQNKVLELIRSVKPNTLFDCTGNQGIYSMILYNELEHAVIADSDINNIDFAYSKIKEFGITNVYPIVLDIVCPSMAYYKDRQISGSAAILPWRESAIDRFKCEMVLALAVMRHLVLAMQLSFDELIGQLAQFSKKYLIIEWIEPDDVVIYDALQKNTSFEWYNRENFECSLVKHFKINSAVNSENTRILYLCEK